MSNPSKPLAEQFYAELKQALPTPHSGISTLAYAIGLIVSRDANFERLTPTEYVGLHDLARYVIDDIMQAIIDEVNRPRK